MNQTVHSEHDRIKFILSYANIFTLCFSVLYSTLLLWGYVNRLLNHTEIRLFPIYFSIIVPVLFLTSYILNLKNYSNLSKLILIPTILVLNFIAGLWWGFDLPSLIISYLFCIVILTLTSHTKENIIYISILITSIFVGTYLRAVLNIESSWHESQFGMNDIVEFSIMFIFITFILMKFNDEQNKTLKRAQRAESVLIKERDILEIKVREKTKEIKHLQMEEISKMYHLIEFGKLSSGLYHDLITPIQTMSLHIEKLVHENRVTDDNIHRTILNVKHTHERLSIMLENIRKQISIKIENERFNLVSEMTDLISLVKNNYFKNNVTIELKYENILELIITTKKSILNHVVLNLISNAYEACLEDRSVNDKEDYKIEIIVGKHGENIFVSVTDNGIGIEEDDLNKIFEHFYSNKKHHDKQNCGIGLSSSKYYTEKYLNGKIYVESEKNLGTTMHLLF